MGEPTTQHRHSETVRYLCVVIPARDEAATIADVIYSVNSSICRICFRIEVVVVDDGSTDSTAQTARLAGARVISTPPERRGLGVAFRCGLDLGLALAAEVFLQIDADGQYDPSEAMTLLTQLGPEAGLVIGHRLIGRPACMSRLRYVQNRLLAVLVLAGLNLEGVDTQSGYRAFTSRVARDCQPVGDFTYTQEQVVRSARRGIAIRSVPVSFTSRKVGKSRLVRNALHYCKSTARPLVTARTESL